MLDEGLVRSRKRLPWQGYGIILLIFVMIIALGLLKGGDWSPCFFIGGACRSGRLDIGANEISTLEQ